MVVSFFYLYTFSALVVVVTPIIPTSPVIMTLHDVAVSWNDANQICYSNGGKLVRLDTAAKAEAIVHLSGLRQYWFGLHKSGWRYPEFVWLNCDGQGEFTLFNSSSKSTGNCVAGSKARGHTWLTMPCVEKLQVVCEEPWGTQCTFSKIAKTKVDVSKYTGALVTIETTDCQDACLYYTNRTMECWVYTLDDTNVCTLYVDAGFLVAQNEDNRIADQSTSYYRKVCFQASSGTATHPDTVDSSNIPRTQCWLNNTLTSSQIPFDEIQTSTTQGSTSVSSHTTAVDIQQQTGSHTLSTYLSSAIRRHTVPTVRETKRTHTTYDRQRLSASYPSTEINTATPSLTTRLTSSTATSSLTTGSTSNTATPSLTTRLTSNTATPSLTTGSTFPNVGIARPDIPTVSRFQESNASDKTTRKTTASSDREQSTGFVVTPEEELCPCECISQTAESTEVMNKLLSSLVISKENLSSFRRKLNSAPDTRVSSVTFGVFAITLISVTLGVIVLADILRLVSFWNARHS